MGVFVLDGVVSIYGRLSSMTSKKQASRRMSSYCLGWSHSFGYIYNFLDEDRIAR